MSTAYGIHATSATPSPALSQACLNEPGGIRNVRSPIGYAKPTAGRWTIPGNSRPHNNGAHDASQTGKPSVITSKSSARLER